MPNQSCKHALLAYCQIGLQVRQHAYALLGPIDLFPQNDTAQVHKQCFMTVVFFSLGNEMIWSNTVFVFKLTLFC